MSIEINISREYQEGLSEFQRYETVIKDWEVGILVVRWAYLLLGGGHTCYGVGILEAHVLGSLGSFLLNTNCVVR